MQVMGNCDIDHAYQCLHAIEFMPDVLTQHTALQIGQDNIGRSHFLNQTAHQQRE
jgi:hypothetical protein